MIAPVLPPRILYGNRVGLAPAVKAVNEVRSLTRGVPCRLFVFFCCLCPWHRGCWGGRQGGRGGVGLALCFLAHPSSFLFRVFLCSTLKTRVDFVRSRSSILHPSPNTHTHTHTHTHTRRGEGGRHCLGSVHLDPVPCPPIPPLSHLVYSCLE